MLPATSGSAGDLESPGTELLRSEQYEDAVRAFDQEIEADRNAAILWCNRGVALDALGRHHEAVISYTNALNIDPGMVAAGYNRGLTESDLAQYGAALASFDKAAALNPDNAMIWMAKAHTYNKMYLFEEELTAYDTAIARDPNYSTAWYDRGVVLHQLNQNQEALKSFEQVVSIDRGLAASWFNKACLHSRDGAYGIALQAFDILMSMDVKNALAWFCESLVLINLGKTNQGKKAFIRATQMECGLSLLRRKYGGAIFFVPKNRLYVNRLDRCVRSFQDPLPDLVQERNRAVPTTRRAQKPSTHSTVHSRLTRKTLMAGFILHRHVPVGQVCAGT